MEHPPYKTFGFSYEHAGKQFAFDILATTREEAEARLASMTQAACVGEMVLESDSQDTSQMGGHK